MKPIATFVLLEWSRLHHEAVPLRALAHTERHVGIESDWWCLQVVVCAAG